MSGVKLEPFDETDWMGMAGAERFPDGANLSGRDVQDFEQEAQELLTDVQNAIDEVAEPYEEADEAMGANQATEAYERAEMLRGNDLSGFGLSMSDPEGCGSAGRATTMMTPTRRTTTSRRTVAPSATLRSRTGSRRRARKCGTR